MYDAYTHSSLKVMKWLVKIGKEENIEISLVVKEISIFEMACVYGDLDAAILLYENFKDQVTIDKQLVKKSSSKIVEWLKNL